MLSEREIKLVRILLENQDCITTDELALKLSVTSRTIKSDIKVINAKFEDKGIVIKTKKSIGVWLFVPKNQESYIYDYIYANDKNDTTESKIKKYSIANFLLNFNEYVHIDDICDQLFYSRSAISRELNDVCKLFEKFNLYLIRNNYGVFVEGKEKDIRIAQVVFYRKLFGSDLKDIREPEEMNGVNVEKIYDIIVDVESKYRIHLTDAEFKNVYCYLAIMVSRYKNRLHRRIIMQEIEEKDNVGYKISNSIIMKVCATYDIEYMQEDVVYLYWYLSGMSSFQDEMDKKSYGKEEVYTIIKNVLVDIDRMHSLQLSINENLIHNLYKHLVPAIYRSQHQIFVENPLLEELKRTFAYAFEISLLMAKKFGEYFQVSFADNEIGLFTLHIAAALENRKVNNKLFNVALVCVTGKGAAELLKARIELLFNNIKVIGTFNSTRIDTSYVENNVDFIISTISLDNQVVPVVCVSPIMKDKDIDRIKDTINDLLKKEKYKMSSLTQLFDENVSFFQLDKKTKEDALKEMCRKLIQHGYANKDIYDSLMRREEISGTSLGQLIAIPHPYSDVIIKSTVAIGVLKKPISWNEDRVQIIFLLCISPKDNKELKIIMENIFNISQNMDLVMKLKDCKSLDQFIHVIENIGKL